MNDTKVVPVEPTYEMSKAGVEQYYQVFYEGLTFTDRVNGCYKAMLAASPTPDSRERAAQDATPIPVCDHDNKPCPPPMARKGRGASRCEQNGVCQRVNINDLPILGGSIRTPNIFSSHKK